MTILGASLSPERIIAWIDDEFFADGDHGGFCSKMTINAARGIVCLGGGTLGLVFEAMTATVTTARDFDHAVRILPERLRQKWMKGVRSHGCDPRCSASQIILLGGYSVEAGRLLLYHLAGGNFFEPVLTGGMCWPEVPEFHRLREPVPQHVARIAAAQVAEFRANRSGKIKGGLVTLCIVRPDSIEARPVVDLAETAQPDQPAEIEEAA